MFLVNCSFFFSLSLCLSILFCPPLYTLILYDFMIKVNSQPELSMNIFITFSLVYFFSRSRCCSAPQLVWRNSEIFCSRFHRQNGEEDMQLTTTNSFFREDLCFFFCWSAHSFRCVAAFIHSKFITNTAMSKIHI